MLNAFMRNLELASICPIYLNVHELIITLFHDETKIISKFPESFNGKTSKLIV